MSSFRLPNMCIARNATKKIPVRAIRNFLATVERSALLCGVVSAD